MNNNQMGNPSNNSSRDALNQMRQVNSMMNNQVMSHQPSNSQNSQVSRGPPQNHNSVANHMNSHISGNAANNQIVSRSGFSPTNSQNGSMQQYSSQHMMNPQQNNGLGGMNVSSRSRAMSNGKS